MTRKHDNKPKRASNRAAKGAPKRPSMAAARPTSAPRHGKNGEGKGATRKMVGAQGEGELGLVRRGALNHRDSCNAENSQDCKLCPVFGQCGGCSQLDVPYAQQLAAKQQEVADLFADLSPAEASLPILGMDNPFHYRNKVASPFAPGRKQRHGKDVSRGKSTQGGRGGKGAGRGGSRTTGKDNAPEILTGMYAPGTHRLVPTDACVIENETGKQVVAAIRAIMRKWGMQPYNEDTGEGFLRHVVVRVGHQSGEVLVTVVTNGDEFPSAKAFCRELVKRVPAITTIVQNVNTRQTNVILGQKERTLYGPGFILDTLCGLSFRISSQSFYQVNATQTEVLYDEAIRLANLTGKETVIDAYCGTGTIGLVAAKRGAARVIGVDSVASAIRDAANNARHNGVENAEFVAEDATQFMKKLAAARRDDPAGADEPLVLLMDPPRAGSTPEFLEAACQLAPQRIVYISCNPATQARDVRQLVENGYEIKAIRPVDMFPHTNHVESIVMLEKK